LAQAGGGAETVKLLYKKTIGHERTKKIYHTFWIYPPRVIGYSFVYPVSFV